MPDIIVKTKEDIATAGQETFKIGAEQKGKNPPTGQVVLNITNDKPIGIVLDKSGRNRGNSMVDWFEKGNEYMIEHSQVKTKSKATFYHLLAVMLNAGIPMVKSLKTLYSQTEDSPKLQRVVGKVAEDVEGGKSLSIAMGEYPSVFSEQEVGMVGSGEESGKIIKVLEDLAHNTEKAYKLMSKAKSAMMYPLFVFGLLIVVVAAMMVLVVPKLTALFSSTNKELPLITKIVVGLSDFLVNHGLVLLIVLVAITAFAILYKKTDTGKYAFDRLKLNIPIFGTLFKKIYLARFAMSLSNLIDSGISIVRAFEITANSIGNEVYRKKLLLIKEDLKQGIPIADNLMQSELFPPMMVSMIEVGEQTAQLGEITEKISDFYESEVDTTVEGLSKVLEPVILVVIGVTVGGVVAAIMMPIMQLSDLAGSF